jgi:hypothetical protein
MAAPPMDQVHAVSGIDFFRYAAGLLKSTGHTRPTGRPSPA